MALDVSTKTGMVVMTPALGIGFVPVYGEIDVSAVKGDTQLLTRVKRMHRLHVLVAEALETHKPALVLVEGYGYANPWTLATLVELGTVVRAAVYHRKINLLEVSPSAVKKFTMGKGAGKKDQMRLAVYKKWGFEHASDNIVDAYAIARIGLCITEQMQPANEAEREVVGIVLHPKLKAKKGEGDGGKTGN